MGVSLLPLIRKLKAGPDVPKDFARYEADSSLADLTADALKNRFNQWTGEDAAEVLDMGRVEETRRPSNC